MWIVDFALRENFYKPCKKCKKRTKSDYVKRERGEWISVKDRLPEKDGTYLIYTTEYFVPDHRDDCDHYDVIEVSVFYSEHHSFYSKNGFCAKYWYSQPLPEPPKGV